MRGVKTRLSVKIELWVLVPVCVMLLSASAGAAYIYSPSQVSPVATITTAQIAAILNQTAPTTPQFPAVEQYQQMTTTDATSAVENLAPLKVVQTDDAAHRYLGVFHNQVTTTKFATYAAYSTDLVHWHTLGAIDHVAVGEYVLPADDRHGRRPRRRLPCLAERSSRRQRRLRLEDRSQKVALDSKV